MADDAGQPRKSVLDPVDRVSEIVFGVLMALTFTGSLSVATDGRGEIRTMMLAALGCNLAWGLTDAVMYLVRTLTERHRKIALLRRIHAAREEAEAHALIADELPPRLIAGAAADVLEPLRRRLAGVPVPPATLGAQDFRAAFGIFVLVVLATFPVVIPFLFVQETALALRLSNALAVATLFACGYALGRHAGGTPWRFGLGLAAVGVALTAAIMALGG